MLVTLMLSAGTPAQAYPCVVLTNSQDDIFAPGQLITVMSLRHALAEPNCDTISIAQVGTISLTSPLPDIDRNLTIDVAGANPVTVRRDPNASNFRIFRIKPGRTVSISRLTISGGNSSEGGGIKNEGALTIANCTFLGNFAELAGGGGAIFSSGPLTITNSTLSGNSAAYSGGAISQNYPSYEFPTSDPVTLTVTDSILSGNAAGPSNSGGAIDSNGSHATITRTKFLNNSAGGGGAIDFFHGNLRIEGCTFQSEYRQ